MSGLGRVVVGYRDTQRQKLHELEHAHGLRAIATTQCVAGCGYVVKFVPSGYDAARYRDAVVICEPCYKENPDAVQAAL